MEPGQTFTGTFTKGDQDCVVLVCPDDVLISFRWDLEDQARLDYVRIGNVVKGPGRNSSVEGIHRVRFGPGRHLIRMNHDSRTPAAAYRITTRIEDPHLELEEEPSNRKVLRPGSHVVGTNSSTWHDVDGYRLEVSERGIYRIRVERLAAPDPVPDAPKNIGRIQIKLRVHVNPEAYTYAINDLDDAFEFFPVLDPGTHRVSMSVQAGAWGAPYRLSLDRWDVSPNAAQDTAARAAIDRGTAWLIGADSTKDHRKFNFTGPAMTLMALCEGSGAEGLAVERQARVTELIGDFAAALTPVPGGTWNGEPVSRFSTNMYEQAFATLALAEAVAAGHRDATPLCVEGVRFLLAAQISEQRPDAWKVPVNSGNLGGWRYRPDTKKGDFSVTGWCLIALYAAAAAELEVPGMTRSGDLGIAYTRGCTQTGVGFRYRPTEGANPSLIIQSIGLLISNIFGEQLAVMKNAAEDLDRHLCAGTEVERGFNAPFYYWYYATRAHYLRRRVSMARLAIHRDEPTHSTAS